VTPIAGQLVDEARLVRLPCWLRPLEVARAQSFDVPPPECPDPLVQGGRVRGLHARDQLEGQCGDFQQLARAFDP
jgi:hypothetical protein